MIKILVVDDSIFMRNVISDMLKEDNEIEIVGKAKNGKEAVELAKQLKPDVITLDVEMPIMNGIQALKMIMKECPTKVIMVSSLTHEGAEETIDALNNGAYDFLPKPSGQISLDIRKVKEELLGKIKASTRANLRVLKREAKEEAKPHKERVRLNKFIRKSATASKWSRGKERVVALGISTGGPKALQKMMPKIPGDIDAGILIVQHMPPKFTKSLADRLDLLCEIKVKEAEDGEDFLKGVAYIAPGDYHIEIIKKSGRGVIALNKGPAFSGHRPSANVLFRSVAENYGGDAVGVIMTGMGGDGAENLKVMHDKGCKTIGQDEESCVVYGMPRVAYELGAVDYVLPLEKIANKIAELAK